MTKYIIMDDEKYICEYGIVHRVEDGVLHIPTQYELMRLVDALLNNQVEVVEE